MLIESVSQLGLRDAAGTAIKRSGAESHSIRGRGHPVKCEQAESLNTCLLSSISAAPAAATHGGNRHTLGRMFTGLIQHLGTIESISSQSAGARLRVQCAGWTAPRAPGDSIAVNGCCLTISALPAETEMLEFDVIHQTLGVTTLGALKPGDRVNLESAATPMTLLGGHIVQGHIDAIGAIASVRRDSGEVIIRVEPPGSLLEYLVERGSIAVDGVSLTIARVGDSWFDVALIPTTLQLTTFGQAKSGRQVNLEADYIAKTVITWARRHCTADRSLA